MLSSVVQLRLQQLENNVARVLKLLNDYEVELVDETDPGTKSKYYRRIDDLKQQRNSYESELVTLQEKLKNDQPQEVVSTISSQLQQIDKKLDWLAGSQVALHESISIYFTTEERFLINPIANQLSEAQVIEVKTVLEAVESNQISDNEANLAVSEINQLLALLKDRNVELPDGNEAIVEVLNQPTLDAKHALKVSIPIIPFILSYEGELELGAGIKLKETWNHWKAKLWIR